MLRVIHPCWRLPALLALFLTARAQQTPPSTIKIPDGTLIPLQLMDNLSSKTNKSDDPVRFKVREDVRVEGKLVIPFGSPGVGRVAMVGSRGLAGKAGSVNFVVDYIKAVDGSNLRVRGAPTVRGGGNTSVAAAAAVAYGPAALLVMRGSHAEIRRGTMFSVYVDGEREVRLGGPAPATTVAPAPTPAPAQPPAALPAAPQPAASAPLEPEEMSTVVLKSTPEGAEITVDGKFVGSTPSTVQLRPGDHTIRIGKSGFQPWQRTLAVRSGGIVNIDATLEQSQ